MHGSGQVGIDPATGKLIDGGISAEADRALKNLGAILQAAGMDYSDVVMATVSANRADAAMRLKVRVIVNPWVAAPFLVR